MRQVEVVQSGRSPPYLGLALVLVVLVSVPGAPSRADDQNRIIGEPEVGEQPRTPILRRAFPDFDQGLRESTPFIRDSSVSINVRTFYYDRKNTNDTTNQALTTGGSLDYQSGWLHDTFAIGAVGYTTQPLYAPEDEDGTKLLAPGQDAITVLGQAYAQLRYRDYALFTGYRQLVNDGYVNADDSRMIPNTFEGATLKGSIGIASYDVGYLWSIKPRNSQDFRSMSFQAGADGDDEGLVLTSVTLTPWKPLRLFLGNYYVADVFNTAFGEVGFTQALNRDLELNIGAQYTDQRSVGDEQLGNFNSWNVGGILRLTWRGLTGGAAVNVTSDEASILTPYGAWPGYLHMTQFDFDTAGETAWGIGVKYDFDGTLLPWQISGLSTYLAYVEATNSEDPATGASLPDTQELDFDVTYKPPSIGGLELRLRNAYWDDGGESNGYQVQLIANYRFDLL